MATLHKEKTTAAFTEKYKDITNTEIYNLSSYVLTPIEKIVLGLGTKYLPLPKTSPSTLIPPMMIAIDVFHRRLRLAYYHSEPSLYSSTVPRVENAPAWNPPPHPTDKLLSEFITNLKETASSHIHKSKSFYNPLDHLLNTTLLHLQKQSHITIKPADKNLGLVILNTSDYKLMCLKHLTDIDTYEVINHYDPSLPYEKLIKILERHNQLYMSSKSKVHSKLTKSLLQYHNSIPPPRIATFYTIPKIHKTLTPPIPGRPIVSSNGTITFHTSVYLDKELQPVLKLLKTICTSSRHIIQDMTRTKFPTNSIILCADVTALYPNIPINFGLYTVRTVLHDLQYFTKDKLNFIMELLRWVLLNNYCSFNDTIYLQKKGTAMGTPTAVVYSNIFLYGIEKQIIPLNNPLYYTRYIDDIYAVFCNAERAQSYVNSFNDFCPSIKLEAVTIGRTGIILDLEVTLKEHPLPSPHDLIHHKIYQKPRNIYQYIPTTSEHKPSLFKNFVLQELNRYSLACTDTSDLADIIASFNARLLARGYDPSILQQAILLLRPRETLLRDLYTSLSKTKPTRYTKVPPLVTLCVPRLDPTIPWGRLFTIPPSLSSHPAFLNNYSTQSTIIGAKNPPTIGSFLIRSKYKDPPP